MTSFKPKQVGVLVGSLRRGSFSRKLAKALIARSPAGLDCKIIEIGDLALYNQDLDASAPCAVGRVSQGGQGLRCAPVRDARVQPLHARLPQERDRHRLAPRRQERVRRIARRGRQREPVFAGGFGATTRCGRALSTWTSRSCRSPRPMSATWGK